LLLGYLDDNTITYQGQGNGKKPRLRWPMGIDNRLYSLQTGGVAELAEQFKDNEIQVCEYLFVYVPS